MITIESTPELVTSVYERMDRTLRAVRQRLGRPMGLAEKVLLAHLDDRAMSGHGAYSVGGEGARYPPHPHQAKPTQEASMAL